MTMVYLPVAPADLESEIAWAEGAVNNRPGFITAYHRGNLLAKVQEGNEFTLFTMRGYLSVSLQTIAEESLREGQGFHMSDASGIIKSFDLFCRKEEREKMNQAKMNANATIAQAQIQAQKAQAKFHTDLIEIMIKEKEKVLANEYDNMKHRYKTLTEAKQTSETKSWWKR